MSSILLSAGASASTAQNSSDPTVIVNCGDISDVTGHSIDKPLQRLALSIKSYAAARSFRLIWYVSGANIIQASTAFYDRRTKTLSYFSRTQVSGLGNEHVPSEYQRFRLKQVSDSMILRLAKQPRKDTSDPGDSFLSQMMRYGAKRQ